MTAAQQHSRSPAWLGDSGIQAALILLSVTLIAYIPAMHGGYIWDDDAFVTDNPLLRAGLHGLWRLWFDFGATDQYYPMAYSSFWLEYQVWGYWATGSHIVNAMLHGLNAWLLWKALRVLRVRGAWLAALIFALHPVEVESVAWITERKNVLSTTFYLVAALAYFRFQPPLDGPATRRWRFYFLSLLLFLCALWSKTVTCSLPVALLLVLWWKKERVTWPDILPLAPMFCIGAGMGLMTGWMEKHVIGAKGSDWALTLPQRFLIAGRAPWFYLWKLVWPHPLMFFYPRWVLDPGAWWQWIFPAATALAVALLWLVRRRIGKAPFAAAAFFAVTLFPALGFIDVYPFRYSFVADHFQYLASIAPITLAAAGLVQLGPLLSRRGPALPGTLCVLLLTALAALTWIQGFMYANLETFYETIIARNPQCWMAYDNLAFDRLQHRRVDESIALSRQALAINPADAESCVNLGNAIAMKGSLSDAEALYRRAISLRPDFAEAHSDLGNVLLYQGKLDDAVAQYRQALAIRPRYAEAHNNLGFALLKQRHFDEAVREFKNALAIQPGYSQAEANLRDAIAQRPERQR